MITRRFILATMPALAAAAPALAQARTIRIGTPAPILARLNAAINKGLASAKTRATLDRFSSIARIGSPADFGAFMADQHKRWGDLVRLTGARVQ